LKRSFCSLRLIINRLNHICVLWYFWRQMNEEELLSENIWRDPLENLE
jgi:hypothetical protein